MFIELTNYVGLKIHINVNHLDFFIKANGPEYASHVSICGSTELEKIKESPEEILAKIKAVSPNAIKTYVVTYYIRGFAADGNRYYVKTFNAYSIQEAIAQAEYCLTNGKLCYDGIHKIEAYQGYESEPGHALC